MRGCCLSHTLYREGSVLSPALFLLVMDPLLKTLEQSGLGLSVNNFYAGGFLHADDIRTLATSTDSLEAQVNMVKDFAARNFLRLNVQKCEIVMFSRGCGSGVTPQCEVDGSEIPVRDAGKCLGYWWRGDLMASRSVEENIRKARKSFFHYGSLGAFQGDLSPLSTKSIIETCVMPILLFGSENWIVSKTILDQLESFLGELAKRALRWPRHFSNTAAVTALDMVSVTSEIAVRKLGFLKRQLAEGAEGVGAVAMRSLLDDPNSLCLVGECRELEECLGMRFWLVLMM